MPLVKAAAVIDQSFDFKSILEDSLKTPVNSSKAATPAPSESPAPPAMPEPPLQPPQVTDQAPDPLNTIAEWRAVALHICSLLLALSCMHPKSSPMSASPIPVSD